MKPVNHKIDNLQAYYDYFKPTELTFIKQGDIKNIKIGSFKTFYDAIQRYNNDDQRYCAYASINPFYHSRAITNIWMINKIFFDIDNYEDEDLQDLFDELQAHNIKYEYHIRSGKGQYLFIPLPEIWIENSIHRSDISNLVGSFIDYFNERFKVLDGRCKDICRLSRVWGSIHYKGEQPLPCHIIAKQIITDEDKIANLKAVEAVRDKRKNRYEIFSDSTMMDCYTLNHIIKAGGLEAKEGTGFNDRLGKNICIYCFHKYGKTGIQLARSIYENRGKNAREADGWFKKAEVSKAFKVNCSEIQNYLKDHYPDLHKIHCEKCLRERRNRIIYTDEKIPLKDLKDKYRARARFFIHDNQRFTGMIEPSDQGDMKKLVTVGWLVKHRKKEKEYSKEMEIDDLTFGDGEFEFIFFGEKKPDGRTAEIIRTESASFYRYTFREGDAEYIILSERQLELEEAVVKGMVVELNDTILIGERSALLSQKIPIIFLYDYHPKQLKIRNDNELFNLIDFTRQDLLDTLFGFNNEFNKAMIYTQPEYINTLILSWLASGKIGYPLHLNIVGPPHCGKSELLKLLKTSFDEQIFDCGGSTIKGLIPSFYGKKPVLGRLIGSRRLCLLDELLNMLSRRGGSEADDSSSIFTTTNNILEHSKQSFGSGKGTINVMMKAKVIAVNNPMRGKTIEETFNLLPTQFLDRFLPVRYTHNHKLFVSSEKGVISKLYKKIPILKILAIFDYLQSFLIEYDKGRLKEIINRYEPMIPKYLQPFYEGRMQKHHLPLIFDGIMKTRCIFDEDQEFKAKDVDYQHFEDWLKDWIRWWWDDEMPKGAKVVDILNDELKTILELIDESGISRETLKKKLEERNIEYKYNVKFLYDNKILRNDGNNKIYKCVESQRELDQDDLKL